MSVSGTTPTRSAPRIVRTYAETTAILRSPAFENSGFDGAEAIMGATLPALSGDAHSIRRRLVAPLFRADKLTDHEQRVLPIALSLLQEHVLRADGSGPDVRVDLVWWAQMTLVRLVADIIGFDDLDLARTEQLYGLQRRFAEIAGPGAESEARRGDSSEALEALRRDFVRPSIEKRRRLADEGQELGDRDLISILISNGLGEDLVVREVNPYLVGARTPGRSTVQTLLNLEQWFGEHPEDRALRLDPEFLLRASAETIRLSPPALIMRRALYDVVLDGVEYRSGDVLVIDQPAANSDPDAFDPQTREFDPHRDLGTARRFATSFGAGRHLCIGRPLTVRPGTDSSAPVGVQVRMLQWLYQAGVELDPTEPPVWKTDARYVDGVDGPVIEHRVLVRCPAILTRLEDDSLPSSPV